MNDHDVLLSYVGKDFNDQTVLEINKKFTPYAISMCDIDDFYLENYWTNQIRCVVDNGKIIKLGFN